MTYRTTNLLSSYKVPMDWVETHYSDSKYIRFFFLIIINIVITKHWCLV